MKNIIILALISLFIWSCQDEPLRGHWHIHSSKNPEEFYPIPTFDIENDTLVILDKYFSYDPMHGRHYASEKKIYTHYEVSPHGLTYKLKNGALTLDNDGKKYFGKKYEVDQQHIINDFFWSVKLDLDIPKLNVQKIDTLERTKEFLFISSAHLYLGKPKLKFQETFGDSVRLQMNSKIIDVSGLDFWISNVFSIYPKKRLKSKYFFTIFADQNVKVKHLTHLINELKKYEVEKVAIACLNPDTSLLETPFLYVKSTDLDFSNPEKTLQDILN